MSRFYVTPNSESDEPIGTMTGYVFDVNGAQWEGVDQLVIDITGRLRVDGNDEAEVPFLSRLDRSQLPDDTTFDPKVVVDWARFFLGTVEHLLNTGCPVAVLRELVEIATSTVSSAPLTFTTESGEPYRCVEFGYDDRPVSRAVLAPTSGARSFMIVNGEFSEWVRSEALVAG